MALIIHVPGISSASARRVAGLLVLLAALCLSGCTTPVGTDRVSPVSAYRQRERSALNSSTASGGSLSVVYRHGLSEEYARRPDEALKSLQKRAANDDRRDVLFALAELYSLRADQMRRSTMHRERRLAPDFYLSSAIFAWMYLFGPGTDPLPDPYRRSFREACEFYNRGLALGLTSFSDTNRLVRLADGTRNLPLGDVKVSVDASAFPWPLTQFYEILPSSEYWIRGISVRNHESGLGAPLICVFGRKHSSQLQGTVPGTVFGRFDGSLSSLTNGTAKLSLELYSPHVTQEVTVNEKKIPLEADLSTPLAYSLNDSRVWNLGFQQFLNPLERVKSGIYNTEPHLPGKIPVVFVHGTFSSPVWWVEMMNTLSADRILRQRCEFWYYIYNSGNPIAYSAANFRTALSDAVQRYDPKGQDPAMQQMVLVGHSQGGLLAKLAVTDTRDALWCTACDKPFDQVKLSDKERKELQAAFFFAPLPFVKAVVFIATPHRGSYMSTSFVRSLVSYLISFPDGVVQTSKSLLQLGGIVHQPFATRGTIPSSLDGMSPENPFLLALANCCVTNPVACYSIIPINGDDQPPAGRDGVVAYSSAHLDYAKSELIVHSNHSCQGRPETIEEVRRVLLEHIATIDAAHAAPTVTAKPGLSP